MRAGRFNRFPWTRNLWHFCPPRLNLFRMSIEVTSLKNKRTKNLLTEVSLYCLKHWYPNICHQIDTESHICHSHFQYFHYGTKNCWQVIVSFIFVIDLHQIIFRIRTLSKAPILNRVVQEGSAISVYEIIKQIFQIGGLLNFCNSKNGVTPVIY